MRAIVMADFGAPSVLEVKDVPRPEIRRGHLLVRVMASALNPIDTKIRSGQIDVGIVPPVVLGFDAAGIVEEIGSETSEFKVGDPVFYTADFTQGGGTYADYHLVDEKIVWHSPEGLSFPQAAALPLAGGTAWDGLVNLAKLKAGERVLIHGGSGGVGSLAVQIAQSIGAEVFATCSAAGRGLLEQLSVDHIIDYRADNYQEVIAAVYSSGVDVVYDTVGKGLLADSINCIRPFGRMVSISGPAGDLGKAYRKNLTVIFQFSLRNREKLQALSQLVASKALVPVIKKIYGLEEIPEVHALYDRGSLGTGGKIIFDHQRP